MEKKLLLYTELCRLYSLSHLDNSTHVVVHTRLIFAFFLERLLDVLGRVGGHEG